MRTSRPRSVCYPFVGDSVGGAQISGLLMARNLDPSRYSHEIVLHQRGPLADYLDQLGLAYTFLPIPRLVGTSETIPGHLRDFARSTPRILHFLWRRKISLVHGQDGRVNLSWCLPSRLTRRPYVWHQRSVSAPSRLTQMTHRFARHTICISKIVANTFPKREAISVVTNPFETDHVARDLKRRDILGTDGSPPATLIVGFVANMRDHKRPFHFVKVAAELSGSCSVPLVFVMLGADQDGLLADVQRAAMDAGVHDKFRFLGFQYPISPWIASFDLLLVPSIGEAFGRTIVEAMLTGTAVIASNSGGHSEIIANEKTGLLVPPDDVSAMCRAARQLVDDRDLRDSIAEEAIRFAKERYSVADHVGSVMNIYDTVLSDRSQSASSNT